MHSTDSRATGEVVFAEPIASEPEAPVEPMDFAPRTALRRLTLLSFGFKYGPPPTNHYFDVSFLKNPARQSGWGLFARVDSQMRRFVLEQPECQRFLGTLIPLLEVLLDCDDDVRVGLGCSAGRHRSAILVEEVARRMENKDVTVKVVHREESYQ